MRPGKKTGKSPKDSQIVDGFNRSKKETISKLEQQAARVQARLQKETEAKEKKEKAQVEKDEREDERSAYQMLKDLRFAYRNAIGKDGKKGKQRLVQLMANDIDFKFAMKELMRIEASLLGAKIRAKDTGGGNGNVTTFVVLKGLHDEGPQLLGEKKDSLIDIAQITNAVSPTAEPKIEYDDSEDFAKPEAG